MIVTAPGAVVVIFFSHTTADEVETIVMTTTAPAAVTTVFDTTITAADAIIAERIIWPLSAHIKNGEHRHWRGPGRRQR